MTKVCISGYYGFDNVGDEAILLSMIEELKAHFEDIEIVVLSDKPEQTAADYGVEACDRWKWWQIHKVLMSSDILISGGGGLLQDVTGRKSLMYYTHIMKMALHRKKPVFIFCQGIGPVSSKWGQDKVVNVLRKATKITVRDEESAKMLHSWGLRKGRIRVTADPVLTLGNIERVWDTEKFVRLLDPSRFDETNINADNETEIEICLVDQATLSQLMAENAQKNEAESAAAKAVAEEGKTDLEVAKESDLEKTVPMDEEVIEEVEISEELAESPQEILKECEAEAVCEDDIVEEEKAVVNYEDYGVLGKHPSVWKNETEQLAVFSLREWDNLPITDLAKAADMTAEAGYKVVFLPFQYPNDLSVSQKVMEAMEYEAELFDGKVGLTPQEIMTIMDEADLVFGMRLHSLIMAAVTKTPFASLSYNPKVESFVNQLGLTVTGDLNDYEAQDFLDGMKGILDNPQVVKDAIEENLDELIEKAESTMDLMHTLLDRIERRSTRKKMSKDERDSLTERRRSDREAFRAEMHLNDAPLESAPSDEVSEEIAKDALDDLEINEANFVEETIQKKEKKSKAENE